MDQPHQHKNPVHRIGWLVVASVLAACSRQPTPSVDRSTPVSSGSVAPVAPLPALAATADAAAAALTVPPSTSPLRWAQFMADGTLIVDHGDQLVFVDAAGSVRARIPYEKLRYGDAWRVSTTTSTPEIALYRQEGAKQSIRFIDASGRETASLAVDEEEAKSAAVLAVTAQRVFFRATRKVRVIERASARVIATVNDAPALLDDDLTRGVTDNGAGSLEVVELDGSGARKTHQYAMEFIDSDGWQGAAALSLSPDGRMLAIQEPKGVAILELPSGRRTFSKGTRLFTAAADNIGGRSASYASAWTVPKKIALSEGPALLLLDRDHLEKVDRFSPKKPCAGIKDCRESLLQWRDVQWRNADPVVLMTSWPTLLVWRPNESARSFDPGNPDNSFDRLTPDSRHVLRQEPATMRLLRVSDAPNAPWATVVEDKGARHSSMSPDGTRIVSWDERGYRIFEVESGAVLPRSR